MISALKLSASASNLTKVVDLVLFFKLLEDTIPEALGSLSQLTVLNLDSILLEDVSR